MRGFGTALQTLAGAFGAGATSYGTTGIEAQKIAEDTRRNDRDYKEGVRRFDINDTTANRRIKVDDRSAMARIQLMMNGGLTPNNIARIQQELARNGGNFSAALRTVLGADDDEIGWDGGPLAGGAGATAPRPGQPAPTPAPAPGITPLRSGPTIPRPR